MLPRVRNLVLINLRRIIIPAGNHSSWETTSKVEGYSSGTIWVVTGWKLSSGYSSGLINHSFRRTIIFYIQIMPRLRKTKKTEETALSCGCRTGCCSAHTFAMKPLNGDPHDKLAVTMEFCPKPSSPTKNNRALVPMFNHDGKEYTPCFFLEGDDLHYIEFDMRYREAHNQRKLEYLDSNKTILEPKHGRKSKICAVCRAEYQDYLQHIGSKQHKQRIRSNTYNGFIEEMARGFSIQEASHADPQESSDYCDSTRQSSENDVFTTKKVKVDPVLAARELKLAEEREVDRNMRWASGLADLLDTIFEKDRESKEQEWEKAGLVDRSFHVEDYLLRFE